MNREQALADIRKDWTIIKNLRKKDKPYQVFLADRNFVKEIIGMKYTMLKWLPQFKDDAELVHDAVLAGEEIEDGLLYDSRSVVFDQAENRLWAQTGLMEYIFSNL